MYSSFDDKGSKIWDSRTLGDGDVNKANDIALAFKDLSLKVSLLQSQIIPDLRTILSIIEDNGGLNVNVTGIESDSLGENFYTKQEVERRISDVTLSINSIVEDYLSNNTDTVLYGRAFNEHVSTSDTKFNSIDNSIASNTEDIEVLQGSLNTITQEISIINAKLNKLLSVVFYKGYNSSIYNKKVADLDDIYNVSVESSGSDSLEVETPTIGSPKFISLPDPSSLQNGTTLVVQNGEWVTNN